MRDLELASAEMWEAYEMLYFLICEARDKGDAERAEYLQRLLDYGVRCVLDAGAVMRRDVIPNDLWSVPRFPASAGN